MNLSSSWFENEYNVTASMVHFLGDFVNFSEALESLFGGLDPALI